jgi:hypothetical protein
MTEASTRSKKVSFCDTQTAYFRNPSLPSISAQERKSVCWYSEQELVPSREDAREALQALHAIMNKKNNDPNHIDGSPPPQGHAVHNHNTSSTPTDVCLRGIEKFSNPAEKVRGQRTLMESVLNQQTVNRNQGTKCGDVQLATVSRYLSQPFKDVARYYAMQHWNATTSTTSTATTTATQEDVQDEAQRKQSVEDQDQEKDTTDTETSTDTDTETDTVMDLKEQPAPQHSRVVVVIEEEFTTLTAENKRPRAGCFKDETSLHRRNVKQCVVQVSE